MTTTTPKRKLRIRYFVFGALLTAGLLTASSFYKAQAKRVMDAFDREPIADAQLIIPIENIKRKKNTIIFDIEDQHIALSDKIESVQLAAFKQSDSEDVQACPVIDTSNSDIVETMETQNGQIKISFNKRFYARVAKKADCVLIET